MLYVNKDKAGEIKMVSKVAVFFVCGQVPCGH